MTTKINAASMAETAMMTNTIPPLPVLGAEAGTPL